MKTQQSMGNQQQGVTEVVTFTQNSKLKASRIGKKAYLQGQRERGHTWKRRKKDYSHTAKQRHFLLHTRHHQNWFKTISDLDVKEPISTDFSGAGVTHSSSLSSSSYLCNALQAPREDVSSFSPVLLPKTELWNGYLLSQLSQKEKEKQQYRH